MLETILIGEITEESQRRVEMLAGHMRRIYREGEDARLHLLGWEKDQVLQLEDHGQIIQLRPQDSEQLDSLLTLLPDRAGRVIFLVLLTAFYQGRLSG